MTTNTTKAVSNTRTRMPRRAVVLLVAGAMMTGLGAPSAAEANHVFSFGYLACNGLATGSTAPNAAYNFNNPSTSYANAWLYRWNGYRFVYYRPADMELVRYGGTWTPRRGWTWAVPAGWYAVYTKMQTKFAWSGWTAAEYGWADTNPNTIVGDQYCYVPGRSNTARGAAQAEPTKAPPTLQGAPRGAPQADH